MKRNAKVVVLNNGTRVEVEIRVSTPRGRFERGKASAIACEAANAVADGLRQVSFIHARPDNTKVTL